ncbi:ganglioside GM2 activator isoform X2 [Hydra vulgaris]|uniref:Ganglioside GM2 activator isoform X2 n=1 Tax=Hydra vulgaris TaxID=6087 RepID=A0ABM4D9R0_HYDVU
MIGLLTFALLVLYAQAHVKSVDYCKNSGIKDRSGDRVIGQLKIRPGHTIPFKVTLDVAEDLPAGGEIELSIKKKVGFFWVPIPCVNKIGSCKHAVDCKILEFLGMPCQIKKGTYYIKHAVNIPSDFSFPSFFVSGSYKINAEARKDGKVYGCVDIEANLE